MSTRPLLRYLLSATTFPRQGRIKYAALNTRLQGADEVHYQPGLAKMAVATITLLSCAGAAWGQGTDYPILEFDGFGTIGLVHSDEDQADFVASPLVPEGAGHSTAGGWSSQKVDSRLGLQLSATLLPRLSGVVQVVAEQRYDGSSTPVVEWANLGYEITPDLTIRAGRMVLPVFLTSEYRKVGYANPWVRPPQEVYSLIPVTNSDGVDMAYRARFGDFINTLHLMYGGKNARVPDSSEIEARDALTVANTLEHGASSLFMSYSNSRLTWDEFDPLFNGFRQFGPDGEAVANRYEVDDKRFETVSLGVRYDPGDWFVLSEWARTNSRTFFPDSRGWYATGGYRAGPVTPYITLADLHVRSATSDPGVNDPNAQGLNAALNQLLRRSASEQSSLALGARWDFAPGMALKVQYDYIDLGEDSSGLLVNEQPDFEPGGNVSLFSATFDFVF